MRRTLICLPFFLLHVVLQAQSDKTPASALSELIAEQQFEFVAESAMPLRGRTIFLSGQYTLTVLHDTLRTNLPYYGRAYQASNMTGGGINFTSTDFSYTVKKLKKRWTIQIKTKDVSDAAQIQLSVSNSGNTSLRVTSINRQTISFNGYLSKPLKKGTGE